jgi:hypothetical protein
MLNSRTSLRLVALLALTVALSAVAQAQATRTWVEGASGDDTFPCSRTAPCKTFAGAISKTAVNGEIDVISPGSYGAVTITKNLIIDGGDNFSGILNSATNGVNINDSASGAPNTIVVTLRNLSITAPANGTNGINFTSGKILNVEGCTITGNTAASTNGDGIRVSLTVSGSSLNVKDTNIFKNRVGIFATTTTGNVTLNVNHCNIENNTSDGIFLDNNAFATVRDSNLSFNGGAGLSLDNGAANSATVDTSELNHNSVAGLFVGTGTTVRLGGSIITQNGSNFSNNGTIVTFCDNRTDTNPIPGAVTTACLK